MAKLVPTVSVIVVRDSKRVKPVIGKSFDFTADEVASINGQHPGALRKPVNETADETTESNATVDGNAALDKTANKAPKTTKATKKAAASQADSQSSDATNDGEGDDEDEDI